MTTVTPLRTPSAAEAYRASRTALLELAEIELGDDPLELPTDTRARVAAIDAALERYERQHEVAA